MESNEPEKLKASAAIRNAEWRWLIDRTMVNGGDATPIPKPKPPPRRAGIVKVKRETRAIPTVLHLQAWRG